MTTTINMRKIGDTYCPEPDHDPYSEFEYRDDRIKQSPAIQQQRQAARKMMRPILRPKEELFNNINMMFEGANLVFDLANHFLNKLGGRR